MAQQFAIEFYRSVAWKKQRAHVMKARHGLCERCLEKGIYTPATTVHHIIHLTPDNINDTRITLSEDNLKLVCTDCHAKEHKAQKRYEVDEFGRVITNE